MNNNIKEKLINKESNKLIKRLIKDCFIDEKDIINDINKIKIKYNKEKKYNKVEIIYYIQKYMRNKLNEYYNKNKKDYLIVYNIEKKHTKHNLPEFETWKKQNQNKEFKYNTEKEYSLKLYKESEKKIIYNREIGNYFDGVYNNEDDLIFNIEFNYKEKIK